MVSRAHLRLLGLDSAPAYRLYLSLCWLWDRHGTAGGRLIGADPPIRKGQVEGVNVGGHLVNPVALHRYPALSPDHLAQMAYATADLAAEGSSTRRTQRQQAREALDRVADQTGAVVVPAPGAAGTTYRATWAAPNHGGALTPSRMAHMVTVTGNSSNERAPVRSSACARPGSAPEPS